MGSALQAVEQVLAEAGEPLHYRETTRRILDRHLWNGSGKTPAASIRAALTIHVKKHGKKARFRRVGSGVYSLSPVSASSPDSTKGSKAKTAPASAPPVQVISFTDAAEKVLTHSSGGRPMHYRDITAKALELGLIRTSGRTPEATMYGSVLQEIQRYRKRGEQPRFYMHGKGMIGLAKVLPRGIPAQADEHNRKVRSKLHARLTSMSFDEFEELVGVLLAEMGFDEVDVTPRRGDKGIDVRGTLAMASPLNHPAELIR